MPLSRTALPLALLAAGLLLPGTAGAAELHRYIPDDTEMVIAVNLNQVLATKLAKENVVEPGRDLINNTPPLKDALAEIGLDPFRDIHRVLIASPGSTEADRGLILIQGQFDPVKLRARADAMVVRENVKKHTIDAFGGKQDIYEFAIPGQPVSLFVCVPAKDVVILSPGKDYVVDALKKDPIKNPPALKNKTFQEVLEKVDDKQTLYLAATSEALGRLGLPEGWTKDILSQMDALAGGFKLEDDLALEIVIGAKTVADAQGLQRTLNNYQNQGLAILGLLATQVEELNPVVDILKTLRCTQKEKAVAIKARVDIELLQKLIPQN